MPRRKLEDRLKRTDKIIEGNYWRRRNRAKEAEGRRKGLS